MHLFSTLLRSAGSTHRWTRGLPPRGHGSPRGPLDRLSTFCVRADLLAGGAVGLPASRRIQLSKSLATPRPARPSRRKGAGSYTQCRESQAKFFKKATASVPAGLLSGGRQASRLVQPPAADEPPVAANGSPLPPGGSPAPADDSPLPADDPPVPAGGSPLPANGSPLPANGFSLPARGPSPSAGGRLLPAGDPPAGPGRPPEPG